MSVRARIRLAWGLLAGSILGWPASYLVPARFKEDLILGLSWIAISLVALDILSTQDVRQQHGE